MSLLTEPKALEASAIELSKKARAENGSPIALFKNFLQVEEERLREWHRDGGGGREIRGLSPLLSGHSADSVPTPCDSDFGPKS